MDFSFNKEESMFRKMAAEFFKKECPPSFVSEMLEDEKGYSPAMWRKMAELGFTGLIFDEKYGGLEGTFLELSIIMEEMGRALLPAPFFSTVILSGLILQDFAKDSLKDKYLSPLAFGEAISTLALTGAAGFYSTEESGLLAEKKGDGYEISGSALFVPYAHVSDIMLCNTSVMDSGVDQGETLFVLDIKTAEAQIIPMNSISGDRLCEVVIKGCEVSPDNIIGGIGQGGVYIERVWPKIVTAKCIEMVGAIQQVLDMTVSYVNDRRQFGKPLAAFQAIQHLCADMAIQLETSKVIAYQAAWMINEGLPGQKEAAMAKAWCSQAFKDVVKMAHQAQGAIGFTEEHDLHLFTKRAKAWELTFGDIDYHRETVATCMQL